MNTSRANTGGHGARWLRLVAFAFVVLLAGCGFHLQGGNHLPDGIDAMYVAYHSNYRATIPPLVKSLRQRLRTGHQLGGADAKARLVIKRVKNSRRIISISPINGRVAEYELRSEVVFDYIVDGKTRLGNQHFAVTRFYSYNDAARLAEDAERRDLSERMQQQLANRILFKIQQVNNQHQEPT